MHLGAVNGNWAWKSDHCWCVVSCDMKRIGQSLLSWKCGTTSKALFFNCVKKVMLWHTVFLVLTGWKSDGNITYQLKTWYQVKFAYLSFKKVFIILGKLHLWLLGVVWVLAAGNARRDYVQLGVEGTIYPASEAGISLWRHCFFTDYSYSSV